MNEDTNRERFAGVLRESYERFKANSDVLAAEYKRREAAGELQLETLNDLLERPTRRFLIDPMLQGLDWNPESPAEVIEEARALSADGDRLYFDYLGIASRSRSPTLLVEAKRYSVAGPRAPRKELGDAIATADVIASALALRKAGDSADRAILKEWAEWLDEVRSYVVALSAAGQATLKRVVITSGQWMIIFENPIDAFVDPGMPDRAKIHCFLGIEDIQRNYVKIYDLLYRPRLIDTLPLAMSVQEALAVLSPERVSRTFRGVVIASNMNGAARGQFPARTVYPALILDTGGRVFAVVDYNAPFLQEPFDQDRDQFDDFHANLSFRSNAFEADFLRMLDRTDLVAQPIAEFPGFPMQSADSPYLGPVIAAEPDSTAAFASRDVAARRVYARVLEDQTTVKTQVVATGVEWFYKIFPGRDSECPFHLWPGAHRAGVAAAMPLVSRTLQSFTVSGDGHHCAHENLRAIRGSRCHLESVESHLCCRSCLFYAECWRGDAARLPCPNSPEPGPS